MLPSCLTSPDSVVSIEFSPLSTIELTTNWYQLHNGDYKTYPVLFSPDFSKWEYFYPVLKIARFWKSEFASFMGHLVIPVNRQKQSDGKE